MQQKEWRGAVVGTVCGKVLVKKCEGFSEEAFTGQR